MLELIKESDLDTVRHFYRALAGTEFCAWTDIYPGEPELQSDFSRDSLFCIRDDVSGEIAGLVSIDDDPTVAPAPLDRCPSTRRTRFQLRHGKNGGRCPDPILLSIQAFLIFPFT